MTGGTGTIIVDFCSYFLDFIFQKSWGSNFRNKDNVVAMVVTGQNDMQERRLYGTTIKNGDVELIDAYV